MKKIILLIFCILTIPTLGAASRQVVNKIAEPHTMERIHQLTNRLGKKQVDRMAVTAEHSTQAQNQEIVLEFTNFSKEPKYYSSGD